MLCFAALPLRLAGMISIVEEKSITVRTVDGAVITEDLHAALVELGAPVAAAFGRATQEAMDAIPSGTVEVGDAVRSLLEALGKFQWEIILALAKLETQSGSGTVVKLIREEVGSGHLD